MKKNMNKVQDLVVEYYDDHYESLNDSISNATQCKEPAKELMSKPALWTSSNWLWAFTNNWLA